MSAALDQLLEDAGEALPRPSETACDRARAAALLAMPRPGPAVRAARGRRRRLALAFTALAASALALLVVALAPWRDSGPLATERALAAIGARPVIHAIVEQTDPQTTVVDLESGAARPEPQRTEYWYDDERGLLRTRLSLGGDAFTELLVTPEGAFSDLGPLGGAPFPARLDPALAGFASRYRPALASGEARVVERETVDGRDAVVLQISLPRGGAADVVVDADDYRPLRFRYNGPDEPGAWWRVLTIESIARDPSHFRRPELAAPRPVEQTGVEERTLTPIEAGSVLGRAASWPGADVAGVPLAKIELVKMTTRWSDGRVSEGHSLEFAYGELTPQGRLDRRENRSLTITVAASPENAPRFGSLRAAATPEGKMRLVGAGRVRGSAEMWFGSLQKDGVYFSLMSPERELVLRAARGLRPMPTG